MTRGEPGRPGAGRDVMTCGEPVTFTWLVRTAPAGRLGRAGGALSFNDYRAEFLEYISKTLPQIEKETRDV